MSTGRNFAAQDILGDQKLTRQETLWLATAGTSGPSYEDDLGSIEAAIAAIWLYLTGIALRVSDEDFKRTRSLLTIVEGKVVHNEGIS